MATAAVTTGAVVPTGTLTHPLYVELAPTWRKLAYVYLGAGGFRDGTALIAHPREWKDYNAEVPKTPTKKLLARRALACYENVAKVLVDQKQAAIFREPITREIGKKTRKDGNHPLWAWWDNVDGAGCSITDYMADAAIAGFVFGHVIHLMDREAGDAPTKADEKALYLCPYSPLDMADWLTDDRGRLTAVRLMEAVPRTDLDQAANTNQTRERIVNAKEWRVVQRGAAENRGEHRMGRLPVVIQYARRQPMVPIVGASELGDPNLYYDLYNLTSEIREILRAETFGILNVPLGSGETATSVETAIAMLGDEKGVENVLFSPLAADYIQPDTANVEVYQKERMERRREIYRQANVPWEADSRDAEAEGSLKLKREDMNQHLATLADNLEKAEYEIAQLWFRGHYGPDRWEQEWKTAEIVIRYPDTFDVTPFAEILEQAQAAITLDMPPEVQAAINKRLLTKFLPDLPSSKQAELEKAIDAHVALLAKQEAQRTELQLRGMAKNPEAFAA